MSPRLFCTLFLLVSVCALPLFFTVAIGIFSIVWFRDYYEALPLAFLGDALYGLPMDRFHSFPYVMTLAAATLVVAAAVIRRQMFDSHPQTIQ